MKNNPTNNSQIKKFANILSLNASEARDFLMQTQQYHTCELPEYFDFAPILHFVEEKLGDKRYEECLRQIPQEMEGVNLTYVLSKDGGYGVRHLTFSNPYLYYFLVREMTSEENWERIKECFDKYRTSSFSAGALPVIPQEKEAFHNATIVQNWWNAMEQRTLELSLDYDHMFITDVSNCYGAIPSETIDWALSMQGTKEETDDNHALAMSIRKLLAAMQRGRTVGLPQGSAVYDLIAEMVLGYADLLLKEKLTACGIEDYQVLRYRDDYRIFSNDMAELKTISYKLEEVLESLNMKMNLNKTRFSDTLIKDALKEDKRFYIFNTPIQNKEMAFFAGLQKHLYFIYEFGCKYKDCSQMKTLLNEFDIRLIGKLYPKKEGKVSDSIFEEDKVSIDPNKWYGVEKPYGFIGENLHTMIAIATEIARENVSAAPLALRVITRLMTAIKDNQEKVALMDQVTRKLAGRPNMEYLELWLQNMTYMRDKARNESCYTMPLCKLANQEEMPLWNNSWLKKSLVSGLDYSTIIKQDILADLPPVITPRTTREYCEIDAEPVLIGRFPKE